MPGHFLVLGLLFATLSMPYHSGHHGLRAAAAQDAQHRLEERSAGQLGHATVPHVEVGVLIKAWMSATPIEHPRCLASSTHERGRIRTMCESMGIRCLLSNGNQVDHLRILDENLQGQKFGSSSSCTTPIPALACALSLRCMPVSHSAGIVVEWAIVDHMVPSVVPLPHAHVGVLALQRLCKLESTIGVELIGVATLHVHRLALVHREGVEECHAQPTLRS